MNQKLFILPLFASFFFVYSADPIEHLEEAIREGNIAQVKPLLQTTTLSDAELATLIDLTQQLMNFSKGQLECSKLTLGLSESPFKQFFSFMGGLILGEMFLLSGAYGIDLFSDPEKIYGSYAQLHKVPKDYSPHSKIEALPLALISTISLIYSIKLFKYFFTLRTNAYKKWQDTFDNSLAIKQLLMKHKNTASKIV